MFGYDHLELSFQNGHKLRQYGEDSSHAFDVGRPFRWVIPARSLVDCWPCFREVHLTRLIDDKEACYWALRQVSSIIRSGPLRSSNLAHPLSS